MFLTLFFFLKENVQSKTNANTVWKFLGISIWNRFKLVVNIIVVHLFDWPKNNHITKQVKVQN